MGAEQWFAPLIPQPADSFEALFGRLRERFGAAETAALRIAMEQRRPGRDRGFYELKNRNPDLSAALTMGYDGDSLPKIASFLEARRALLRGDVLDAGCENGILTMAVARMAPAARVTGVDRCRAAVEAARRLAAACGAAVQFQTNWPERPVQAVLSVRALHENFDQSGVPELETLEESGLRLAGRMRRYAGRLAACADEGAALLSVERCGADRVLLGWLLALGRCGFHLTEHGTISAAECGRPAQFQGLVLRRGGEPQQKTIRRFCDLILPREPVQTLRGTAAEAYLLRWGDGCRTGFAVRSPDGLRMGRSGVWMHGDGGRILLFQASASGCFLQVMDRRELPAAEDMLRRSAAQARAAGYRID